MVTRQFSLLMLLILVAPVTMALDKIQASIETNTVTLQEYFVLNIIANDELDAGNLDTHILLKDFIVGRTSISRSTQMINFDTKKETRWQILLAAKKLGKITIPAFEINGIKSNLISLDVVQPGSKPQASKPLFIETDISIDEAYVGQLITYKVRLYLAAELQRGVLSAPVLEGAQIKQLGDDNDSDKIINGRRFRVIERTYGITPDFPGELTINGASFSGDILINTPNRRGGLFTFNESRPVQTTAKKHVILINPLPLHVNGTLVADLVLLNDSWDETATEYQVGTPITRNITLVASNTDETNLPELTLSAPDAFKTYPEKAVKKSTVRNGQQVSQLTQAIALVPTKPGEYTLPEITLPWWNSQLKRQEIATIPARKITVIGAESTNQPKLAELINNDNASGKSADFWPWISLCLAIAWLITLVAWYRKPVSQITKSIETPIKAPIDITLQERLQQLTDACQAEDVKLVLVTLQNYINQFYGQKLTLEQISQMSPELMHIFTTLQIGAYGKANIKIDFKDLLKVIKNIPKIDNYRKKDTLIDLNP